MQAEEAHKDTHTFHKQSDSYNSDDIRLCVQEAADLGMSPARNVDPGHFHHVHKSE